MYHESVQGKSRSVQVERKVDIDRSMTFNSSFVPCLDVHLLQQYATRLLLQPLRVSMISVTHKQGDSSPCFSTLKTTQNKMGNTLQRRGKKAQQLKGVGGKSRTTVPLTMSPVMGVLVPPRVTLIPVLLLFIILLMPPASPAPMALFVIVILVSVPVSPPPPSLVLLIVVLTTTTLASLHFLSPQLCISVSFLGV